MRQTDLHGGQHTSLSPPNQWPLLAGGTSKRTDWEGRREPLTHWHSSARVEAQRQMCSVERRGEGERGTMRTGRHKEALFYGCADCKILCPKIIRGGITSNVRKCPQHHVGQPCWPVEDQGLLWVQTHPGPMFGFGPLDVSGSVRGRLSSSSCTQRIYSRLRAGNSSARIMILSAVSTICPHAVLVQNWLGKAGKSIISLHQCIIGSLLSRYQK